MKDVCMIKCQIFEYQNFFESFPSLMKNSLLSEKLTVSSRVKKIYAQNILCNLRPSCGGMANMDILKKSKSS